MNSNGDSQSARARARVPGPSAATGPDGDPSYAAARPAPDAYRRGAAGQASVGAPRGSASVGAPAGRAAVGAASVGSARVGAAYGPGQGTGSYGGRAAVARAAVRPSAGPDGFGDLGGGGNGLPNRKDLTKLAKRRRRANVLTAAAAVVVILLGAGVVGGTWFFDGVDLPQPKSEDQATTIRDANNKVLAKLGSQNRTVVPDKSIPVMVQRAVAAAEDKNFYDHHGIDFLGIARAAWNNFTGGDKQGASTITQQYARHAAELKDISYNRKLREAVIARKLESKYDKQTIMGLYLNSVYFGEGRYGIEAAAQGYFGKSVLAAPNSPRALTVSEAAVLASIIKQPEPVKGGHKGFDPNINPDAAKDRWQYTLNNMLEMKWITPEERAAAVWPEKTLRPIDSGKSSGDAADKPVGMIIRHVKQELRDMGIDDDEQRRGGLDIKTTIDPDMQKAAEESARRSSEDSPMHDKPKSYQAALIAIDPNNGQVKAYYGGDNPTGLDYAGYMDGETGQIMDAGGQSPGSTWKPYTLTAGLQKGISFETHWDGTEKRIGGGTISNAGADPGRVCGGQIKFCQLEKATVQSYNFPFYWIANKVGPSNVLKAAKDAGIRHIWTDAQKDGTSKLIDLERTDASTWNKYFAEEIGFGQYRVVPLEHANGVATIINGGVYHKAHFIASVSRRDENTGKMVTYKSEKTRGEPVFPADQMSDLLGVLQKIPAHANKVLRNGRPAAVKTGTWEFNKKGGSGDAWMVGGIPQLAATVWIGGANKRVELKSGPNGTGRDMFGSSTPGAVWKTFMDKVTAKLDMKIERFPDRQRTGDPNSPLQNGKQPPPPPADPQCLIGFLCPGGNNNGGDNNGNNGGGNNGGNNGPGGNNGGNNNGDGGDNDGGDPTTTFPGQFLTGNPPRETDGTPGTGG
ncbi:membrane peptidoglycan carboxypeptidase [Krasilnikovia cinnamomea]|uniref:Membrane peptidoglycan carboxypeptidase n=1 Tax=Krasilnikovia cinnamomea TaxID=349313 RepID=A0A4Q7ZL62_9ACTN|nr:transglycosylase domain-containing protein [Krasilnikovia cinnamomea]RZU51035.1 membrane peptidoglycan carboxypeptidase [Krasilnikovia cinnamomea]